VPTTGTLVRSGVRPYRLARARGAGVAVRTAGSVSWSGSTAASPTCSRGRRGRGWPGFAPGSWRCGRGLAPGSRRGRWRTWSRWSF